MSRPAGREAYFDNAKFVIGCLVVVGHAFTWVDLGRWFTAFEAMGSSFRMPVFAFLVGYFSQGFLRSTGRARRLIAKIALAYLAFDLLYKILDAVLGLRPFEFSPLSPYTHLWFLTAMFVWRGSAPLWWQMRHPFPVAVFVSLVAGLSQMGIFTKILSMLPFFVLGLLVKREHFEILRRPAVRLAAVGVLVAEFAVILLVLPEFMDGREFFRGLWNRSYADAGFVAPVGTGLRFLALFGTIAVGAAVLSLIPARSGPVSRLGSRSLYMYVLHYAVIRIVLAGEWFDLVPGGPAGALLTLALCVVLGVILCSRPTQVVFRSVLEPPTDWLFKHRAPKPRPASAAYAPPPVPTDAPVAAEPPPLPVPAARGVRA
ncbi:acyltransferase family protein [Actinocorallia aurea]